jgi:hypothetical protein
MGNIAHKEELKLNRRSFIYGALVYPLITFPLAVLWHVVAFRPLYETLGFFGREEPSFALGLLAILIQGILLSYGYLKFGNLSKPIFGGLQYAGLAGLFFWTCHVVAFAAKHELSSIPLFFGMETVYLLLQFGLYGLALGLIYNRISRSK